MLQLLNLIWKHIHFQNDNDSVPSKFVIKLYICSVFVQDFCQALWSCSCYGAIKMHNKTHNIIIFYLFIYLFICIYLFIYLLIYLFIYLGAYLFIYYIRQHTRQTQYWSNCTLYSSNEYRFYQKISVCHLNQITMRNPIICI